jgi:hypothetical protein
VHSTERKLLFRAGATVARTKDAFKPVSRQPARACHHSLPCTPVSGIPQSQGLSGSMGTNQPDHLRATCCSLRYLKAKCSSVAWPCGKGALSLLFRQGQAVKTGTETCKTFLLANNVRESPPYVYTTLQVTFRSDIQDLPLGDLTSKFSG